ncbi:MAG: hypothetical protein M1434_01915 [Chloroflexi bacterium]|nr:hypothetical protein [Chloroflexota bacterium]
MERAAFLIEETNQRIGCLLNPESLLMRRAAGLRPRQSLGGQLTGAGQNEDALIFTGGGRTELELDLLFDVSLTGSTITTDDVRDLTAPLWGLAENSADLSGTQGYRQPPLVRFVWGKSWNIPCVVAALAERLEEFTPEGAPTRSWLRMRIVRVNEPARQTTSDIERGAGLPNELINNIADALPDEAHDETSRMHEVVGGSEADSPQGGSSERLDDIAYKHYGNSSLWRLLAAINNIDDPMHIEAGTLLRIPQVPGVTDGGAS